MQKQLSEQVLAKLYRVAICYQLESIVATCLMRAASNLRKKRASREGGFNQ